MIMEMITFMIIPDMWRDEKSWSDKFGMSVGAFVLLRYLQ